MNSKKFFLIVLISLSLFGCTLPKPCDTGFLSDCSKLHALPRESYRYTPSNAALKRYGSFMIDPVVICFYDNAMSGENISAKDQAEMSLYLRNAVNRAISDKYPVVRCPGPEVARLKMAITNLKKSKISQNGIPIIGAGLADATFEAELIDSQTGQQLGAFVGGQPGSIYSPTEIEKRRYDRKVMDNWAMHVRNRLDEVHD